MRALVQQVKMGHPSYEGMERSAYWFWERGYEVIRFEYSELERGDFDELLKQHAESTIVRAGVGTVRLALQRAGKQTPDIGDLPADIRTFAARRVWESTLGQIRSESVNSNFDPPIHVKPLLQQKLFTGLLVSRFGDLIPTAHLADDVPILCQERVNFLSEWRCYILRDKVLHVGYYKGDPLLFPDPEVMRQAIPQFGARPIAFALDWGITDTGATVLVEVNDGFSLGNYGLWGHLYTAMVEARWRELMGLPDNLIGESFTAELHEP